MLTQIHYRLVFASPEPLEKLQAPHESNLRDGIVTNTLKHGIRPQGGVVIMQQEGDPR